MTDLLKDKTNKALVSMSLPISIGMLSTFLFQVIDTYFVGQLGAEALTALSFSSTIYFLFIGLLIGLSVGVSIIVGQSYGGGDVEKVKKVNNVGSILTFGLSAVLSALTIVFIESIFGFLGAEATVLPLIKAYTIPLLSGMPVLAVGILFGSTLRATGNITKPEVIMGIAGVINLIFDYGLIFGKFGLPEMGIQGAAYATVLSWIFVFTGMVLLLLKDKLLVIKTKASDSFGQLLKEIYQLGIPTIITQIIGPFTLMYLTFLLARQSPLAVAAFGVAGRIEMLLMIGILGVSTAITPFIAQNMGAHQKQRIEEAIAFGGKSATYLGLLVALILFIFIRPIAGIFTENSEVIDYTANYFYLVSLSYFSYGLYLITSSIFNGLKLPVNSLKISLVKTVIFTLPLTFIGSIWGIPGIFIGLSISNLLGGFYAGYEIRKEFKRVGSALKDVNVWNEYKKDILWLFGQRKNDS